MEYPNTLPVSGDRLRKKYNAYWLHSYEVLVHGLMGRESNRKASRSTAAEAGGRLAVE